MSFALLWFALAPTKAHAQIDTNSILQQGSGFSVTHTVGFEAMGCTDERYITIFPDTNLFFCLRIQNDSGVTLTTHYMTRTITTTRKLPMQSIITTERYTLTFPLKSGARYTLTRDVLSTTFKIPESFALQSVRDNVQVDVDFSSSSEDAASLNSIRVQDQSSATVTVWTDQVYLPLVQTVSPFAGQRSLWQTQNITSYTYTLHIRCFCVPPAQGIVIVQDNQIVSVLDPETHDPFDRNAWKVRFKTINELFELLDEMVSSADQIDVDFHQTLGYPTNIDIDYMKEMVDDEISYNVNNLTPIEIVQ
ncbi:hypothetical protein KFU94_59900 [Chloroflexi bacterium TSY]|nr:hypothetical protein [Chloroflexi bacterium TSY]